MQKVLLYTPQHSSRKYKRVTDKALFAGGNFPPGTIFVLRYLREGKCCFETLKDCPDLACHSGSLVGHSNAVVVAEGTDDVRDASVKLLREDGPLVGAEVNTVGVVVRQANSQVVDAETVPSHGKGLGLGLRLDLRPIQFPEIELLP